MILHNLFIVAALLSIATAQNYRLPTSIQPSHYNLDITLPSEIFSEENATSYTGSVAITFKTTIANVSQIVLHASTTYLNITNVTVTNGTTTLNVTNRSVDNITDILTIALENVLTTDLEYLLTITFDGTLSNTDMYGFYKSSFTDSSGNTSYLATTQMEATHARRAFPCFDEPSYKATFNITLTYPTGLTALANTDVLASTPGTDTTTTAFKTTPVMSSYLVAFIVSPFTCSTGEPIEGTLPNKVCSRNETADTRQWALSVTPLAINTLNNYLGINYSTNMAKMEQIAIPDFSAGAMENWGLVTYRERALLLSDTETSNAYKQYIATVITHELSHQWFGNLVTCKWWSEIFLNEGFATFFEHFGTHEFHPEYELDIQFVTKTLQLIFQEDASSTEALRTEASSPSEISARFGGITYDKGGSILRMVQHVLGTTAWKTSLNKYLNDSAYSSVEPDNLWAVLNTSTTNLPAENLSIVMENWINQPGFPVVNVALNGTSLNLSQKRFVYSNKTDTNTTWYIPITFTTSQNTSKFDQTAPEIWLTPNDTSSIDLNGTISWVVINNQQTGFYRVNYDTALWEGLTTALQQSGFSGIPVINRAQIVDDAFNLARAGYITYSQAFNVTQFLASETSYHVWYAGFSGYGYVLKRFGENSTLGRALSNHLLNVTSTLIASVPLSVINDTEHIYTLNQVQAQSWACKLGHPNCTTAVVQMFASYKNSSVKPNKNLRSIVYSYGLKYSTNSSSDWDFLWNEYLNTSLSTEQVTILGALGCVNNEAILNGYLNKTLQDNSGIRSQDYASVFSSVYSCGETGVNVALDFFIANVNSILKRYTSMNGVGNILKGIAAQITTDAQILKLQTLVSNNALNGTLLEAGNAALTTAQNNYQWVNTYKSNLNSYFGIADDTTTTSTTTTTTSTTRVPTTTPSSADKPYVGFIVIFLGLLVIKF